MKHVSPPNYWKDRYTKQRKPILVVRQDRYGVDSEHRKLILRGFDVEIGFAGRLKWYGKQGRLEIVYGDTRNAWCAHIPVEVGVEETRSGKKSKYVLKGEGKSIWIASSRGDKMASVDLGINVVASVAVGDGIWLLYRGVRVKEDYFYFQKKIADIQSSADKTKTLVSMRRIRSC